MVELSLQEKPQVQDEGFSHSDSPIEHPERYIKATAYSKKVQRKAFKSYNIRIKKRLDEMSTADRNFWTLIKDLTGLSTAKSSSAPSSEALATHFAKKMSNGKDEEDDDFELNNDDHVPLSSSSFKIRGHRRKRISFF